AVRLLQVEPEDLLVFPHAFRDPRLEPPSEALVQFRAQLLWHRVIRRIANQDVPEPETVVAREQGAAGANEFLADEGHQVATDAAARRLRQELGERAAVEHAPLDRRTFDHRSFLPLEPIDPRTEQRL